MGLFGKKKGMPEENEQRMEHPAEIEKEGLELSDESGSMAGDRNICRSYLERVMQTERKGVAVKVYLENFKRLNEVFGYDYCERMREQIIRYLQERTGSRVYRYVGVEFIMVWKDLTQGQAVALAEELMERFSHVWKVDGTDCLCSAQIGLCAYPGYAEDVDELLKYLDWAVTKAVELGPNQVIMYDTSLHTQYMRRKAIALYLGTAMEKEEIEVRYRPVFNIDAGKFQRAEFFMRVFVKGLGMIASSEFLPIAEDSGQIRAVEYYALNQVGKCIGELVKAGREFDSIALPVSSVLLLQEDFLDEVKQVMAQYQIPKKKLAIEIKEDVFLTSHLNTNVLLQELADIGVEIILNDFGTAASGVNSLLDLPVHTVKFGRMFIWQLETNPKSAHIIRGLIQIGNELGLHVMAEGVETEGQVLSLCEFGCKYQQGLYYSPSLSQEALVQLFGISIEETFQFLEKERDKQRR